MIFNDGVTSGSVISVSCPFSASLRSWWCGGGGPVGARVVAGADSGLCTISDLSSLIQPSHQSRSCAAEWISDTSSTMKVTEVMFPSRNLAVAL